MFEIVSKEMLTPAVCRMQVNAPLVARAAKPGQFLIVIPDGKGERTPLTISDYDALDGKVTIVTQAIGVSSSKIVNMEVGDSFADVAGPLGVESEFVHYSDEQCRKSRFVFLAGGVGAAPVYPQAKWLKSHGAGVDVIIGAKTKNLLIYASEMASACDHLHICTDDGSEGFHGLVTEKLRDLVSAGEEFTRVVAIGPMIMMKYATLTAKELGLPITVSLNTLMLDGTGMCGACRVSVGGKTRFACVDGPEFDGYLVDFDEAMRRQKQYLEEERSAMSDYLKK